MPDPSLLLRIIGIDHVPVVPRGQFPPVVGTIPSGDLVQPGDDPAVTVVYFHLYIGEEFPVDRRPEIIHAVPVRGEEIREIHDAHKIEGKLHFRLTALCIHHANCDIRIVVQGENVPAAIGIPLKKELIPPETSGGRSRDLSGSGLRHFQGEGFVGFHGEFHQATAAILMIDVHHVIPGSEVRPAARFLCTGRNGVRGIGRIQGEQHLIEQAAFLQVNFRGAEREDAVATIPDIGRGAQVHADPHRDHHIGGTAVGIPYKDHIGFPSLQVVIEQGIVAHIVRVGRRIQAGLVVGNPSRVGKGGSPRDGQLGRPVGKA